MEFDIFNGVVERRRRSRDPESKHRCYFWAQAIALGISALSAKKQADAADRAQGRADYYQNEQLRLAKEKWELYRDKIFPLELEAQRLGVSAQQLALSRGEREYQIFMDYYAPLKEQFAEEAARGIDPQYENVARDAAAGVDASFDRQRAIEERNLQRSGLRPDAGRYQETDRQRGLARAAARADQITRAVQNERYRVEDAGFNRLASAIGRQPAGSQPAQGVGRPGLNPNYGGALGNAASYWGNQASNLRQGVGQSIATGLDLWDRFGGQDPSPPQNFSGLSGVNPGSDQDRYLAEQNAGFQHGGLVPPGRGYAHGGVVTGPGGVDKVPATIDGIQPARLTAGEYIIPKPVVEAKGTEFFERLIDQYDSGGPSPRGLEGRNGT